MLLDHQAEHDRRQEADPDHDLCECYCCCLDCKDLIEKERAAIPGERIGDGV